MYQAPAAYTKEAFGVEYLYAQSGFTFDPNDEELDVKIDEGFCEGVESGEQVTAHSEELATIACPADMESDDEVQLKFNYNVILYNVNVI